MKRISKISEKLFEFGGISLVDAMASSVGIVLLLILITGMRMMIQNSPAQLSSILHSQLSANEMPISDIGIRFQEYDQQGNPVFFSSGDPKMGYDDVTPALNAARINGWPIVEVHENRLRLAHSQEIIMRDEFESAGGKGAERLTTYWTKYLNRSDRSDKYGVFLFYSYDMYYFVMQIPTRTGTLYGQTRFYTMRLRKGIYETGEGVEIIIGDTTQITETIPAESDTPETQTSEEEGESETGIASNTNTFGNQGTETDQQEGNENEETVTAADTSVATTPSTIEETEQESGKGEKASYIYPLQFVLDVSSASRPGNDSSHQEQTGETSELTQKSDDQPASSGELSLEDQQQQNQQKQENRQSGSAQSGQTNQNQEAQQVQKQENRQSGQNQNRQDREGGSAQSGQTNQNQEARQVQKQENRQSGQNQNRQDREGGSTQSGQTNQNQEARQGQKQENRQSGQNQNRQDREGGSTQPGQTNQSQGTQQRQGQQSDERELQPSDRSQGQPSRNMPEENSRQRQARDQNVYKKQSNASQAVRRIFSPPSIERPLKIEILLDAPIERLGFIDGVIKKIAKVDTANYFGFNSRNNPFPHSNGIITQVYPHDKLSRIDTQRTDIYSSKFEWHKFRYVTRDLQFKHEGYLYGRIEGQSFVFPAKENEFYMPSLEIDPPLPATRHWLGLSALLGVIALALVVRYIQKK